jgi:DNA repair protein RecO (recombination protein O)
MRRILRAEAVCLRMQEYRESSKLVTLFTHDQGRVNCIAKGARRPKSKFGAALDLFAVSNVIYYWRETTTLYTLSDAELLDAHSRLALVPGRFLAAEQMAEFCLRVIQPHDPSPHLYGLLRNNLEVLETAETGFPALVGSFLLKAASFLGFRPELRRCLICRRPPDETHAVFFDASRGGIVCSRCSGESPTGNRLSPAELATLSHLLFSPSAELFSPSENSSFDIRHSSFPTPLPLILGFLSHHFDPLLLNSFRWPDGID